MIVGDPYKFAIGKAEIRAWNVDDAFSNGVLLFFVDGAIFPKEIVTAALNCEVRPLKERLGRLSAGRTLFAAPKEDAFRELYGLTYPQDIEMDNDYRFDLTPPSLADHGCYVFELANGGQARILAAELTYNRQESRHELSHIQVSEAELPLEELREIAAQL